MTSMNPDQAVARHTETASRVIEGEAVLLRPMDNHILNLNETGTRIWELLADRPTVRHIAETIAGEFDVSEEQAVHDVTSFLEELRMKKLIEVV